MVFMGVFMSHKLHHSLALLPLMSILSLSPAQLEHKSAFREVASITVEKIKNFPKYEKEAKKVDKTIIIKQSDLSHDKYMLTTHELHESLIKEEKDFKKDLKDKNEIAEQKKRLEDLTKQVVISEENLKDLQEKKVLDEAQLKASLNDINANKIILEDLLSNLEKIESKDVSQEIKEVKVSEEKKEVPKKEDKKDEKEENKEDKDKIAKTEDKDDKKEEKHECNYEEKNLVLSKKVEELMAQQNSIMQTLLSVTQMMVSMNQQQSPFQYRGPAYGGQYQYAPQNVTGNWVYMPSQNQAPQQYVQMQQRPEQQVSYLPTVNNNWGLVPEMNLEPRFSPVTVQPGPFGDAPFMYNMTPTPMQQTLPMAPMAQMPNQNGMAPIQANFQVPVSNLNPGSFML